MRKPKKSKSKVDAFPWCTRIQAAQLISLSPRQFDDAVRPRLPEEARQGKGGRLRYSAPHVVSAFVGYRVEQEIPPVDIDDPLMAAGGSSSPQLERYRKYKADLAEREVKELDKDLVRRGSLVTALHPALAAMRGTAERLGNQFGNEAVEIYNEGVDEFVAAIKAVIGEGEPSGEIDGDDDGKAAG
jgi:hypothetical protein